MKPCIVLFDPVVWLRLMYIHDVDLTFVDRGGVPDVHKVQPVPRNECIVVRCLIYPKGRRRVRRSILQYILQPTLCGVTHGQIRRIDKTRVEVILVGKVTNDDSAAIQKAIGYLSEQYYMREEDYSIDNRCMDPHTLGYLDRDFVIVKSDDDSEKDLNLALNYGLSIKSDPSIPDYQ